MDPREGWALLASRKHWPGPASAARYVGARPALRGTRHDCVNGRGGARRAQLRTGRRERHCELWRERSRHGDLFSRLEWPEGYRFIGPPEAEGAGKAGPRLRPVARLLKKMQAAGTTGAARQIRPSPRDGVNAYTCSPRGPAVLPPSPADHHHQLGLSVGRPGPHAFAVRAMPFVRRRFARCNMSRPSHFAANVRDDRDTSPAVQRNAGIISLIWANRETIYVFQNTLTASVVVGRFARRAI